MSSGSKAAHWSESAIAALDLFGWRRTDADAAKVSANEEDVGPRGLLIRDPFASQILRGEKIWEIRGRATQIRGPVVIVKSGTGKAYGTVNLVRVLGPLDAEDLKEALELPTSERDEIARDGLPYPKTYAYVFSNPRWFERPIPYTHRSGAVTWVRLPDLDLDAVRYAMSSHGTSQPALV
jgi:hypothetical protein